MLLGLLAGPTRGPVADFPQAEISNGQITAKLYLPDARNGYYTSTRFDWSGAVYSLVYRGHEFYGVWYDRIDPAVVNWVFRGSEIVSGPCSALAGPVNEFETPLGWDEAQPGGTFIKLGVGVLRKGEGRYNRFVPYDVLDPGKWTVTKGKDAVEFMQVLSAPDLGGAYEYRKGVRLEQGQPVLVIEHSMKNTGRRAISSNVYNHHFMVLDSQPPGPDFTVRVPFEINATRLPPEELAGVRGNEIVYRRPLAGQDEAIVLYQGFGDSASDHRVTIENRKTGTGVRIAGDRPLIRSMLWSIRTVLAVEPYIAVDIQPGGELTWRDTIEYYTIPPGSE
ncbi:MAG: hypothetical protein FIB01_06930 [Gemmatimonadetes bacterium]|nr:hypothetical protein [Gemmatimonadota bacterium]